MGVTDNMMNRGMKPAGAVAASLRDSKGQPIAYDTKYDDLDAASQASLDALPAEATRGAGCEDVAREPAVAAGACRRGSLVSSS